MCALLTDNIVFGRYTTSKHLYICRHCLKYMRKRKSMRKHKERCTATHPPGDKIYEDDRVAVYEVDGRRERVYSQSLCLLSKLVRRPIRRSLVVLLLLSLRGPFDHASLVENMSHVDGCCCFDCSSSTTRLCTTTQTRFYSMLFVSSVITPTITTTWLGTSRKSETHQSNTIWRVFLLFHLSSARGTENS